MADKHPYPWSCKVCDAHDGFVVTLDKVLHVPGGGHVGRVVDADGMLVYPSDVKGLNGKATAA